VGAETEAAQRAVEELVAHYQAKARAVSRAGVAVGATVGVLVGAIPLSPLRAAWPIPSTYGFATLLGGLVVGVLIGYVVGDPRGKLYQRMAEQARLQLQLEQRVSQNDARMAQLLTDANATVTIAHSRTRNLPEVVRRADIVIAAVGRPEMVRGAWIKPGATVIDVGINRLPPEAGKEKGRLVGDVAYREALDVAGAVTPVPGGVGPMTIAVLLRNTLVAAHRHAGLDLPEDL